jgi:hypothetical protein
VIGADCSKPIRLGIATAIGAGRILIPGRPIDVLVEAIVDRRAAQHIEDLMRRNPSALLIHVHIVRRAVTSLHATSRSIEPVRNVVQIRR